MNYIFFDLETTDTNFVGQILEYAFVYTDSNFEPISILQGSIVLNPIQIPSPDAIHATKINIENLLNKSEEFITDYHVPGFPCEESLFLKNWSEYDSMHLISDWIKEIVERDNVALIAHNGNNFDIPFLRTSMIRNGVHPYFTCTYGDSKNMLKYVACKDTKIYDKLVSLDSKRPFALQNACRAFNIIDENTVQKHRAIDDVILTIELCKKLVDHIPYVSNNINDFITKNNEDRILKTKYVSYEEDEGIESGKVITYGSYNKKYFIFLDVKKAIENRKQILDSSLTTDEIKKMMYWCKLEGGFFYIDSIVDDPKIKDVESELVKIKNHILEHYKISLDNFFPTKICDIEQHIYMMPFGGNNELSKCIKQFADSEKIFLTPTDKFAKILLTRFKLNNCYRNTDKDEYKKVYDLYMKYRYGLDAEEFSKSQMIVTRFKFDRDKLTDEDYHTSFIDIEKRTKELIRQEIKVGNNVDHLLGLQNHLNRIKENYKK